MALKLENGVYALGPSGLPTEVSGLEELLQNALLRLSIPRGSFPYGRELGSGLRDLDRTEEHAGERAAALANEALLDLPGVRVRSAKIQAGGAIVFTVETPLGEGEVTYGEL